jgi:hypothetical protein
VTGRGAASKAGRGWGDLRGDVQEVRELAQWLRDLIDRSNMTTRKLEENLGMSRDKISKAVNGAQRPQWATVQGIVTGSTRDPRWLDEARRRWERASPATATRIPIRSANAATAYQHGTSGGETEIYQEWIKTLQACNALEHQLGEHKGMVLTLRLMESQLRSKVRDLTRERDALRQQNATLHQARETQELLATAVQHHQRAEEALRRARAERDEAERLRAVAEQQAGRWRNKFEDLQQELHATTLGVPLPPPTDAARRLPSAINEQDDIDRALDKADVILIEQAAQLAHMARDLQAAEPAPGRYPRLIVSEAGASGIVTEANNFADSAVYSMDVDRVGSAPSAVDIYALESAATLIRTYEAELIPKLLQCPEYADAFAATNPWQGTSEYSCLIEQHRARHEIMSRTDAPRLWAVIDEAALHRRIGDPWVMKAQLEYLIEQADRPNVTVQVLPYSAAPVQGGAFTLFCLGKTDLPDLVWVDRLSSMGCLTRADDVSRYTEAFDRSAADAFSPSRTLQGLQRTIGEPDWISPWSLP